MPNNSLPMSATESTVVAAAVRLMTVPSPTPVTAMTLTAMAPNTNARRTPGSPSDACASLAARIRCPTRNANTLDTNVTGKAMTDRMRALAATTLARRGRAEKVDRIMPVVYSDVIDRMAREPRMTPASSTPTRAVLVGSSASRWAWLISFHWFTWAPQTMAPRRTESTADPASVYQVERSVLVLVHSARRVRSMGLD